MQLLKEVLYKAGTEEVIGNTNVAVYGISINSREVKPGKCMLHFVGPMLMDMLLFSMQLKRRNFSFM